MTYLYSTDFLNDNNNFSLINKISEYIAVQITLLFMILLEDLQ